MRREKCGKREDGGGELHGVEIGCSTLADGLMIGMVSLCEKGSQQ